ncbi:EAL domain-containing protein [Thalassotalea marina]|nr:EAL domain-containing protein [Thalassotalea marina]
MSSPIERLFTWVPRLLFVLVAVCSVLAVICAFIDRYSIALMFFIIGVINLGAYLVYSKHIQPILAHQLMLENWAYMSSICGSFQPVQSEGIVATTINKLIEDWQSSQNVDFTFDQEIRSQVFIDPATGIGNREFFNNRLEALLKEEDIQGAVFFIQLNETDQIQALYGDLHVKQLLKQVISNISKHTEKISGAYIARRCDYELALIIPGIYFTEAERLAGRLVKAISSIPLPIGIEKECFVHIGVSYFSNDENSYQIKSEADMALRTAQLQGPSQWFMYEPGEVEHVTAKGSLQWRTFLEKAISHNAFVLFFQPVVSTKSHNPLHHEVLAKVRDVDGTLVNARVFIPMAVKCGLIKQIDLILIEQVCRLLSYDKHMRDDCSVNVSIESLLDEKFIPKLLDILAKYHNVASQLIFEITEYHLVNNVGQLATIMNTLNQLGVRLLIDKVGQYISAAEYLKHCPINFIKLHASIVHDIDKSVENQIFVRSIALLCQQQNIAIYALGVERFEQWSTLIKLGVEGGQGHYFTEPVSHVAKAIHLP